MGQIVIDIPNKTTRRYNVKQAEEGRKLLQMLDKLFPSNGDLPKLTKQQLQDLKDGIQAEQVMAEWRRTGESYSLEEIREELGLA